MNALVIEGNLASEYPEPKDKRSFIMSKMYDCNYDSPLPCMYTWPKDFCGPRILPEKWVARTYFQGLSL